MNRSFCIIIKQPTTAFYQQNNAGFLFIDTETNKHFSTFAHNKQFYLSLAYKYHHLCKKQRKIYNHIYIYIDRDLKDLTFLTRCETRDHLSHLILLFICFSAAYFHLIAVVVGYNVIIFVFVVVIVIVFLGLIRILSFAIVCC